MLRIDVRPKKNEIAVWTESLVRETRTLMSAVLPLAANESAFLDRLNGAGDVAPELLTSDPAMQVLIREHPGIQWKAFNVKKRVGSGTDDEPLP